jgi:hypothetical protein
MSIGLRIPSGKPQEKGCDLSEGNLRSAVTLRRELRESFGPVISFEVEEIRDIYSDEELRQIMTELKRFELRIGKEGLLETDRAKIVSEIQKGKNKVSDALELSSKLSVVAQLVMDRSSLQVGSSVSIEFHVRNKSFFDITAGIDAPWPIGLEEVDHTFQPNLTLERRSSDFTFLILRASKEGEFSVGPFAITCKGKGQEKVLRFSSTKIRVRARQVEIEPTESAANKVPEKKLLLPAQEVATRQPEALTQRSEQSSQLDELMQKAGKGLLLLAAGVFLSRFNPAVRKIPKHVVVNEGVRWTTAKYGDTEVTIIGERPMAVVAEDIWKGIVVFRMATPTEIRSAVDSSIARRLEQQFVLMMKGKLASWRPRTTAVASVGWEDGSEENEIKKKISEASEKQGEEIDEEKMRKIPLNPFLRCAYYKDKRFGFLNEGLATEVHVLTYSRPEKLYFDGVDHNPLSLADVKGSVDQRSRSHPDCPKLIVLGSPTGWDDQSKSLAQQYSDPRVGLVLVDLKTMDTYYSDKNELSKDLATQIQSVIERFPREAYGIDTEDLDNQFFSGTLNAEEYKSAVLERLSKLS